MVASLGRGPGRVLHGGRLRGGPRRPRRPGASATAGCGRPGSAGSGPRAGTGSGSWATRRRPRRGSRSASAAQLYARPLANALYFYENERDGPDFIHTALRSAPGHLNDVSAMTYRSPPVDENGNFKGSLAKYATGVRINASGGWFDAGDYLHFVETTSYTEAILLQGIASFPGQMGGAGPGRDRRARTSPARPGSAWTSCSGCGISGPGRCTTRSAPARRTATTPATTTSGGCPRPTTSTRARTRTTSTSGTRRCSGRASPAPRSARTSARRLAADFALCYQVFRHSDPGYAANCLREAETVYAQAGTHWKGQLLTALPWDFYPETSWHDDMMLGATELARALQEAGPLGQPARAASRSGPQPPTCGTPLAGRTPGCTASRRCPTR